MYNSKPKVSIIMPLYNKEAFVKDSIASALKQTYENLELIIVYDKSNDRSLEFAKEYESDSRIRIVTNSTMLGVAGSRNKGIESSTGDIVAFLDSDDVYHKDKIRLQVNEMLGSDGVKDLVVYTGYYKMTENGEFLRANYLTDLRDNDLYVSLLKDPGLMQYATIMCTRQTAFDSGLFNEKLGIREDYDFALRLARGGPFTGIHEPLYGYRIHQNSIMHNTSVRKSYQVLYGIMEREIRSNPELRNRTDWNLIRRQIAKSHIITRNYRSALHYTLKEPLILGDYFHWLMK